MKKKAALKEPKQTYYLKRGKVHLLKSKEASFCGVKLEDVNHMSKKESDITCQKCLAFKYAPGNRK